MSQEPQDSRIAAVLTMDLNTGTDRAQEGTRGFERRVDLGVSPEMMPVHTS
jgi:hypothetical protein